MEALARINLAAQPASSVLATTPGTLVVYTDGSCSNARRRRQAGIGVFFGPDDPRNVSARITGRQSNNRAELLAAVVALRNLLPSDGPVEVRTDSAYVVNAMSDWIHTWATMHDWNRLTNASEFQLLQHEVDRLQGRVTFRYVPAHVGIVGNEEADRLAVHATRTEEAPFADIV